MTGLVFLHTFGASLREILLSRFGVRVRVKARPVPAPDRPGARPSRQEPWPAFRVRTRPGP